MTTKALSLTDAQVEHLRRITAEHVAGRVTAEEALAEYVAMLPEAPGSLSPPLVEPLASQPWDTLKTWLPDELSTGWIFRGQPQLGYRLSTSLERSLPDVGTVNRADTEMTLLFEFRKAAQNFMSAEAIPDCNLDWLGAMQHHGAPTRLLDFTRSFYVAAYFAVETATAHDDAAIWAINEVRLHRAALARLSELTELADVPEVARLSNWVYFDRWGHSRMPWWVSLPFAAPAGLTRMSRRQMAQQATFLITGDPERSFEDNLRATFVDEATLRDCVRCYRVSSHMRGEILSDLRRMNITRASLYPGLDGFAQSLKYMLAEEPVERRALLKALRGDSREWTSLRTVPLSSLGLRREEPSQE